MSSKAGSSIGAFLLSLPVSAMLLMMVFGVPRFAPGTNGENGWDQARQFFSRLRGDSHRSPEEMFGEYPPPATRVPMNDPFAPLPRGAASTAEAPRWGDPPASGPPASRGAGETTSQPAWPFVGLVSGGASTPPPANARPRMSGLTESEPEVRSPRESFGAALTWTEARRRLTELGIEQFHLEPGLHRDHYLFVCLFSPGDDPRVTHRFEAEAADPLAAVQDVLGQIDGWLSQRYADRARQIIPPAGGQ
jgi:hypothetical protein